MKKFGLFGALGLAAVLAGKLLGDNGKNHAPQNSSNLDEWDALHERFDKEDRARANAASNAGDGIFDFLRSTSNSFQRFSKQVERDRRGRDCNRMGRLEKEMDADFKRTQRNFEREWDCNRMKRLEQEMDEDFSDMDKWL